MATDVRQAAQDRWSAGLARHLGDGFEPDLSPKGQATVDDPRGDRKEAIWCRSVPARFRAAHIDDLDGEAAKLAGRWDCESNVLLLGEVGVGKTHCAVALARLAFDEGASVAFWPAVELLDELRPGGGEGVLDRVLGTDVLVLDDLGTENPSDWTAERLFMLVNRRYLECLPTIVTSNLSPTRLEEAAGAQMYSRLYEGAQRLQIAGDDRRRT